MLRLRVACPADRTDEVIGVIQSSVGTCHLAVLKGASRDPQGDIVLCDVVREAVDPLLGDLEGRGLGDTGEIAIDAIGTCVSRKGDEVERAAPGDAADAVVWESLVAETHEESTLSFTYLAFLTLAAMIAACGVVLDNAVLVVGAMAVGPEFGPVAGICVALVQRKPRLIVRSLVALLAGFAVAMAITAGFSLLADAFGLFTEGHLTRERTNTAFIWHPDKFSFVVALLAGAAGTLSLTASKSGLLIGVAISVTTVPAAANASVALSYGLFEQAWGSSQQLLLNMLGLVLAGSLMLLAQKLFWAWRTPKTKPFVALHRGQGGFSPHR